MKAPDFFSIDQIEVDDYTIYAMCPLDEFDHLEST
jgi:hypothetical protein